ncbi:MAG TPA: 2-C-methyl-D-erythritol 4-phosphate cytidylyltransferase [Brumimicrobium sp.]|nr:2-C-methyl-D-erythritol 4-phosphate cytidylyltransferase [Brumimicrobium sp.]
MKLTVIITAGGIGKRMGSNIPKQFLLLNEKPLMMHTVERFYNYSSKFEILISLPHDYIEFWKDLCKQHSFTIDHKVVEGGKERYHSIKNALQFASGDLIFVHDAVRPLVSKQTIKSAEDCAILNDSAIPVLPLKDSLRRGSKSNSLHVDRSQYWTVQTPQVFKKELLLEAYSVPYSNTITDDSSLVEKLGKRVFLSTGNEENIKITTPFDIEIAEFLLKKIKH